MEKLSSRLEGIKEDIERRMEPLEISTNALERHEAYLILVQNRLKRELLAEITSVYEQTVERNEKCPSPKSGMSDLPGQSIRRLTDTLIGHGFEEKLLRELEDNAARDVKTDAQFANISPGEGFKSVEKKRQWHTRKLYLEQIGKLLTRKEKELGTASEDLRGIRL